MKSEDEGEYQTDYWRYTDDGYLMFSGTYFSEELYVLTLSSAEEHVAFRILPLDAKCRELNEKYLLPKEDASVMKLIMKADSLSNFG